MKNQKWYKANAGNNQGLIVSENDGRNIAVCYDIKDADLIAAAPELLEALLNIPAQVLECKHTYPHTEACFCCLIKSAISKAEGN